MIATIIAAFLFAFALSNASAQQSSSSVQQTADKAATTDQATQPKVQQQTAMAGATGGPTSPLLGGRTGTAKVGNGGAANYSIPIVVPPGTNGVQSNLAFTYNSQSQENELLGIH